jgi:phosphoglucomutase
MNVYVIRKATQGLANYLNKNTDKPSVAIGYDSRLKSDVFAKETAAVLAANGIDVWLYPALEPVPALSFAVRELKCSAGVMVTASHNPAKYNGYKVYGSDGCQMTTEGAEAVLAEIEALDIFADVKNMAFEDAVASGRVKMIDNSVLEAFYAAVKRQVVYEGVAAKAGLKLVYSPLNGTGNVPVRRVLADIGFDDSTIVPEQEMPDGNFPTCPFPNPEVRESLALGLKLAEKMGADLMLATDPDADRVGIAVKDGEDYKLLSGNEVGVLLLDYICSGRRAAGTMPDNPVAVRSLVSTPMADAVAKKYGVEMRSVLTGFKYIGEQILALEKKGEENRFVFGFEESYGYLAGTHVRDKDAVVASMLIAEMAAWHKTQNSSLYESMQALYNEYGTYVSATDSFGFEGLAGMRQMAGIMKAMRAAPPAEIGGFAVLRMTDYDKQVKKDLQSGAEEPTGLPRADVLEYVLEGGHSVIVRPSGTEPKIKVYYVSIGADTKEAEATRGRLSAAMEPRMKPQEED